MDLAKSGYKSRVELNGGGRESNSAMNNNTWRHVAAVFPENASNLNSIKFYIDGAETGYAWIYNDAGYRRLSRCSAWK